MQLLIPERPWFASGLIRVIAFLVDVVILTAILYPITLLLNSQLGRFGDWSVLLGFVIEVLYFGLQNSHICRGQTLAKRLFSISVVDENNSHISLSKSFLRAIILLVLLSTFEISFEHVTYHYIVSLITIGGSFTILYLLLFNQTTNQNVHDLFLGTYVVNLAADTPSQNPTGIQFKHIVSIVFIFILTIAGLIFSSQFLHNPTQRLQIVEGELLRHQNVIDSEVVSQDIYYLDVSDDGKEIEEKESTLDVWVRVSDKSLLENEDFAKQLAAIAKNKITSEKTSENKVSQIDVSIEYGYEISMLSKWHDGFFAFNYDDLAILESY